MSDLSILTDEALLKRWQMTAVWLQDAILGNTDFPQSTIEFKEDTCKRYEEELTLRGIDF